MYTFGKRCKTSEDNYPSVAVILLSIVMSLALILSVLGSLMVILLCKQNEAISKLLNLKK